MVASQRPILWLFKSFDVWKHQTLKDPALFKAQDTSGLKNPRVVGLVEKWVLFGQYPNYGGNDGTASGHAQRRLPMMLGVCSQRCGGTKGYLKPTRSWSLTKAVGALIQLFRKSLYIRPAASCWCLILSFLDFSTIKRPPKGAPNDQTPFVRFQICSWEVKKNAKWPGPDYYKKEGKSGLAQQIDSTDRSLAWRKVRKIWCSWCIPC